jgi:sugar phosphate isomerase/epimerase
MKRLCTIAMICISSAAFAQEQPGAVSNAKVSNDRKTQDVFAKENLVAWCIVPFDVKERGPAERAESQEEKVAAAGRELLPLLKKVKGIGSKLGLYNHGGWSGQPENLVAVCEWLRNNGGGDDVGIVYNLHHAHDRINDFASALKQMQPYLLCLNINGMNDNAEPKIVSVGKGQHDQRLLNIIRTSGYKGPIGILDHRPKLDAEQSLRENLEGLKKLNRAFNQQRSGLKNQ